MNDPYLGSISWTPPDGSPGLYSFAGAFEREAADMTLAVSPSSGRHISFIQYEGGLQCTAPAVSSGGNGTSCTHMIGTGITGKGRANPNCSRS